MCCFRLNKCGLLSNKLSRMASTLHEEVRLTHFADACLTSQTLVMYRIDRTVVTVTEYSHCVTTVTISCTKSATSEGASIK